MSPLPKLALKSLNLTSASSLLKVWSVLKQVPKGGVLMGRLIGRMAPYTGTIRPEVIELQPGHARLRIADRPSVRNHLNCVHALALMNLGEATTGVAMLCTVPDGARGIVTHLEMDYLKKARGPITAECLCEPVRSTESKAYVIEGQLRNEAGEVVATAKAHWLVGPSR